MLQNLFTVTLNFNQNFRLDFILISPLVCTCRSIVLVNKVFSTKFFFMDDQALSKFICLDQTQHPSLANEKLTLVQHQFNSWIYTPYVQFGDNTERMNNNRIITLFLNFVRMSDDCLTTTRRQGFLEEFLDCMHC